MFTALFNFFADFWDVLKSTISSIWDFIKGGWQWVIGLVSAGLAMLQWVYDKAAEMLGYLGTGISAMQGGSQPNASGIGDMLAFANWILPVNEGFAMLVTASALWVAMLIYRFVKSLIPTVA